MGPAGLAPAAPLLAAGVLADALLGDPQYPFHPVRLIGKTLTACELALKRLGCGGYFGGCVLFLVLVLVWVAAPSFLLAQIFRWNAAVGLAAHVLLLYILLALRDLIDHVRNVQRAAKLGDLQAARKAAGLLVGRDTTQMDFAACRRAAIESLAENFVDGFLSAVFWYVFLGIPGILLFKVVSTMDSMVGYKTPEYLRFGWCGARTDDFMNYVPARLGWLVLGLCAPLQPGLSARKAWRTGLEQHAVIPGPNAGWAEAAMAGLLQRRLVGPIRKHDVIVTGVWVGDPNDPEGGSGTDVDRGVRAVIAAASIVTAMSLASLSGR